MANENKDIKMDPLHSDVILEMGNGELDNSETNSGEKPSKSESIYPESQESSLNIPTTLPDQLNTQVTQQGNNISTDKDGPSLSNDIQNPTQPQSQATALPDQMNTLHQRNIFTDKNGPGGLSNGIHKPKPQAIVLPRLNNTHQKITLIAKDEVDTKIGGCKTKPPGSQKTTKPPGSQKTTKPPGSQKSSLTVPTVVPEQKKQKAIPKPDVCLFCLDGGDLIHICSCSALTHKDCALEYIRFPGRRNDTCCQCREKLQFEIVDQNTPMETKYILAFIFLIVVYLLMICLSVLCTTIMIPQGGMNIYVWLAIIANVSILWPLLIVYILGLGLDCWCGPRNRASNDWCRDSGCYCSGDCGCDGGGGSCDCGDAIGEGCGVIICVICLIAILIVLIAASAYLINSLVKLFKSFTLKSKKQIHFKHEGRMLNTIAKQKNKV